ncbi:MAG: hypothetical protein HC908_02520 [Calothrix sp. SM1_7_51]|nr:hypothetical protein [Calothrix sp. SM1_7_51]
MDGTTLTEGKFITPELNLNWKIQTAIDFNSDGQTDILLRNTTTGENKIWLMNGMNLNQEVFIPQVPDLNWKMVGLFTPTSVNQEPNNSINTAFNLGVLNGSRTLTDSIDASNNNDYYRFTLNGITDFQLTLDGLSADADVELLDTNGNSLIISRNGNNESETINRLLSAGTYYIRVFPSEGSTSYNLKLTATPAPVNPAMEPNNTLNTAFNLGIINENLRLADSLGGSDINDYYRFTLNQTRNLQLTIDGLVADVDVELLNASGEVIASSFNTDTESEWINTQLTAGNYFIRVYPYAGNTNYNLNL